MNVQELIEALQDFDPEMEVRIAYQSNYPLRASVENIAEIVNDDEEDDSPSTLWIAASDFVSHNESPYAPRAAWDNYY